MKQFLRLLLAVGVLAFAASMLAVSCGKAADPNNNNNNTANNNSGNNNSGGSSGGSGGGNPTPPPPPAIALTNFDTTAAKLVAGTSGALDTVRIKASAFPTVIVLNGINASIRNINAPTAPIGTIKHVFDITITGGNAGEATGGLIMVGGGDIGNITNFADPTAGILDEGTEAVRKEGYSSDEAANTGGAGGAAGVFLAGWRHRGIFLNEAAPTAVGADTAPFAFTPSGGSQPGMFCLATITTITDRFSNPPATTALAGGQIAKCYIVSKGAAFTGTRATAWLNTAASATFKKTFNIAIGGFRTDAKGIKDFMPGADDNAKVLALDDGLSSAEITEIIKTNPSAYKKVAVTLVSDTDF